MKKLFYVFVLLFSISFLIGCEFNNGSSDPVDPNPIPEVKKYKVDIFYDGLVQSTLNVEENTLLSRPENPTKEGYVFDNWYVDYFFTETFNFDNPITGDLTIYGRFLKELIVSFENVDADNVTVLEGNKIPQPQTPTKDGYTFDGWYTDNTYTSIWNFNTIITENVKLYGKWSKVIEEVPTYTITYVTQRGQTPAAVSDVILIPATLPVLEADGYIFGGWYIDEACTTIATAGSTITQNTTLYAKWTEIVHPAPTYSITYTTEYGQSPTILTGVTALPTTLPVLVVEGYTFGGWYIDEACTTIATAGSTITQNTTLYAKWTMIKFIVSFESNGGSNVDQQEVKQYGLVIEPNNPTRDGYTFDGWYFDEACIDYWQFNIDEVESDIILYAKWIEDPTYSITFITEHSQTPEVITGVRKIPETLPVLEADGYTFGGWYIDEACATIATAGSTITQNTTLYAKWSIVTLTVSFDGIDIPSQTINYGKTATKPNNPQKDGYRFVGWFADIDNEIIFDFNTPIYTDITITVGWIKTYTISFVSEFGTFDDIVVDENSTLPILPNPSYNNYIFAGWYIGNAQINQDAVVDSDLILTAKWESYTSTDSISIIDYSGYYEAAYVEFGYVSGYTNANDYKVYYKLVSESDYTPVDAELIRLGNSSIRCDILGLAAGEYDILIEVGDKQRTLYGVSVNNYDRSGYAHFKATSAVGAYKNDGTVMDNAIIVYVTDQTKNTVTLTVDGKTYTGIAEILQYQYKFNKPLIVRIIGTINAATWNSITYTKGSSNLTADQILDQNGNKLPTQGMVESEILSSGYNSMSTDLNNNITKLNGLTNKITYKSGEFDSYYNMLDVKSAKNVTVEGVGTDAKLYQWGFTWSNCSYIEVRNLTFSDYTEDACSFQGPDESTTIDGFTTGHIWIHHNTFNRGKNNWDVCPEQDKLSGDGATDLKCLAYVTIAYNHYYKCKKTGLVGGSDDQKTACITFHHNYYDQNGSRLPLGRQANMHMYNNYYYKNSSVMSLRAGAYAFVENCVFESCSSTIGLSNSAAKLYNNVFTSCKGVSGTTVTDRTTTVSNSNIYNQKFDTDSNVFYYDSSNKKTNVSFMLEASDVALFCKTYAGVLKENFTPYEFKDSTTNPDDNNNDSNIDGDNSEVTQTVVLTLNSFSAETISSATTVNGVTIYPKTNKTATIKSCNKTIAGTSITKYISFGGGSLVEKELCIEFSTTKEANITVYYASGAVDRYINLMISNGDNYIADTPTEGNASTIVSHTFKNIDAATMSVASSNSSIDIYCIVIEYLE